MVKFVQQITGFISKKVHVHIAVNNISIKTKQLKNIEISTFISVGVGTYFNVKYTCFFPTHNNNYQKIW